MEQEQVLQLCIEAMDHLGVFYDNFKYKISYSMEKYSFKHPIKIRIHYDLNGLLTFDFYDRAKDQFMCGFTMLEKDFNKENVLKIMNEVSMIKWEEN